MYRTINLESSHHERFEKWLSSFGWPEKLAAIEGDVEAGLEALLNEALGESDRHSKRSKLKETLTGIQADWIGQFRTPTNRALADLLAIHLLGSHEWIPSGITSRLKSALNRISFNLLPNAATEVYLAERASTLLASIIEIELQGGRRVLPLVPESAVQLIDGCIDLHGIFKLDVTRFLLAEATSGGDIWCLRNRLDLAETREGFDATVSVLWKDLGQKLQRGFEQMFDNTPNQECTPRKYLDAFPLGRTQPGWLETILTQFSRRVPYEDGFRNRAACGEWLLALAEFSAWTPHTLRSFADVAVGLRDERKNVVAVLRVAILSLWEESSVWASYGALAMYLLLRTARRLSGSIRDEVEWGAAKEFVSALVGGDEVAWLMERLEDLPFASCGERVPWRHLSDTSKGRWRHMIRERLRGNEPLRRAFLAFALNWSTKDVFEDLVPLFTDLIVTAPDFDFLESLAEPESGMLALRARGVVYDLRFHPTDQKISLP